MPACGGCRDAWNTWSRSGPTGACERDAYGIEFVEDRPMLSTSPYPRGIPGVSRERNVNGVSFAVANATGFVARALEATRQAPGPHPADIARLFATLEQARRQSHA